MARVANRALKTAIAAFEHLGTIDEVYTLRDAARRFGVARNTVVRWSESGMFVAKKFVYSGRQYRYYTAQQCEAFEETDFYKSLVVGPGKAYVKVSATVHDFYVDDEPVIFTLAEFAAKLGLSVQSMNRMDLSGQFSAKRVCHNNRIYRYYTLSQYEEFMRSNRYEELNHVKNADLIGRRFGKLTVVAYSDSAVQKGYYGSYRCECDCGNVVDVPRSELLAGKAKSCGCKFHDLSGLDFGWWHVDSLADFVETTNGQKAFRYNCTCVCGQRRVVFAASLRSGHSQSCGCRTESIGETHIRTYLNSIGLQPFDGCCLNGYRQHKTYAELIGVGGKLLSYDFYVVKDGKSWLIEYQGQQHYRAVEYFGGDSQFKTQRIHDEKKREYAKHIGVSLIEISYEHMTYSDIATVLVGCGIS